MNIFMTSQDITESVKSLDNRRLNKQISECKAILNVALYNKTGYSLHPVVKYYANYPAFVAEYATRACEEYAYRFGKEHAASVYFASAIQAFALHYVKLPPILYASGLKTDPNCLRITDTQQSLKLFRDKLITKWNNDKYAPQWTNRKMPAWYKEAK